MNPLLIAGATTALSFAKDMFTGGLSSPQAAQAKAADAAKNAASEFSKTFEAQKTLQAQQAQAEEEARQARPMGVEAQTVALEAFNARQENITRRLEKTVSQGRLSPADAENVRNLQLAAQSTLDNAMADGKLSFGEFRQVSTSIDQASRQLTSYRVQQAQFASPAAAQSNYQSVSITA
ncbi:hypothetical protein NNJEOMEG_01327 [Fundidesulfovibrio magnetotacticus]|uniref:Uncharacterized protein n=1 Tax=Fundidesulfovibrio magnetotacticus TaxID=2730080 RepID=A0A6V8LP45_9BACT|nr:hypothetical protein [Fundidesulfovibrio magnetotacticus]GFK93494.1 hypothetical protein NNJEOMEG_01327 [Fundidesulfovibrio magnetotacticus]